MNGGDASADGAFSDYELAAAGDERGVSNFNALDVGDGVVSAGHAVEGDSEVAGTRPDLGDAESASTEDTEKEKKSAEKRRQEREYARSHHKCCSITRRRQYKAWKRWFRILLGKAVAVRR